jgi:hypothetical protein
MSPRTQAKVRNLAGECSTPEPIHAESVMRFSALVSLVLVLPTCHADDAVLKPVTPAEAAKLIDKKVTVEMAVKSTGKGRGVFFLNSEEDHRSAGNFTAFINEAGAEKFREAKVDDPAAHFKGKTVRVTGTVKLYRDKPEIVVEDPSRSRSWRSPSSRECAARAAQIASLSDRAATTDAGGGIGDTGVPADGPHQWAQTPPAQLLAPYKPGHHPR